MSSEDLEAMRVEAKRREVRKLLERNARAVERAAAQRLAPLRSAVAAAREEAAAAASKASGADAGTHTPGHPLYFDIGGCEDFVPMQSCSSSGSRSARRSPALAAAPCGAASSPGVVRRLFGQPPPTAGHNTSPRMRC